MYERFAATQPDGRHIILVGRFYTRISLAAAYRTAGDWDRWRAQLLAPDVEASEAWASPSTFLRLAYMLLPRGKQTRDMLRARSTDVTRCLYDALVVLSAGPSHTRQREGAAWLAIAQIQTAVGFHGDARRALRHVLAARPATFTTAEGAAALAQATAPAWMLATSRQLRGRFRRVREE